MKIENIVEQAYLETKEIEFKVTIEEGKNDKGKLKEINWLKTICAFSNTEGGVIYIGVDDETHDVRAFTHKEADKLIQMIHRQIRNRITPLISYDISTITIPAKEQPRYVICVVVEKSSALPVALHEEGLLGIYVRSYGRTDIASSEQIRNLVLMSENVPYDSMFTDAIFTKEWFSEFLNTAESAGNRVTEKELILKKVISDKKKLSKGALLFTDDCEDLITKVVATHWPGINKGDSIVINSQVFTGNLISVIRNSVDFVSAHSANGFVKQSNGRSDYIAYPPRSVLEGIVNAVAHRNYYIDGTQIAINIYKDRLEITSPGSLLGVQRLYKEKSISSIIPRRRNEIICSMLELCKLLEGKGTGFDKIEEDYAVFEDRYRPFVSCDAHAFTLTLPDVTYKSGVVSETDTIPSVYVEGMLSGKHDLSILAFCFSKERTVKEISEYLNVTPSTYFRRNVIGRLCNDGFLIEVKHERGNTYRANTRKVKLQ